MSLYVFFQAEDMLIKLRDAQHTAITEAWFDNLTDVIFRVEAEKQVRKSL